jgi:hypothetical protein
MIDVRAFEAAPLEIVHRRERFGGIRELQRDGVMQPASLTIHRLLHRRKMARRSRCAAGLALLHHPGKGQSCTVKEQLDGVPHRFLQIGRDRRVVDEFSDREIEDAGVQAPEHFRLAAPEWASPGIRQLQFVAQLDRGGLDDLTADEIEVTSGDAFDVSDFPVLSPSAVELGKANGLSFCRVSFVMRAM